MKTAYLFLVVCTFSNSISQILGNVESGSFFETDADLRRIHRNLLQTEEGNEADETVNDESVEIKTTEEPPREEGKWDLFTPGEDLLGPERFYRKDKTTSFLMEVKDGVKIIKNDGSLELKEASSITGSYINAVMSEYEVAIDWKGNAQINMRFNKTGTDFTMTGIELTHASCTKCELKVKTSYGYKVNAAIGLAWACDFPGTFEVKETGTGIKGVEFPNIKLQVFFNDAKLRKFGPLWYCGELMPIGLWVGILVTLFFALICYWGFSMLANIQTMDRFDDPKGKQIYVPQTN